MNEHLSFHGFDKEPVNEILGQVPVVSITGSIASGKDTAGSILQQSLGFTPFSTSDILRSMVASTGLTPPYSRELLSTFVWDQIDKHGEDFWVKYTLDHAAEQLQLSETPVGITHIGTRIPADIAYLKQFPNTLSIWIESDVHVRTRRLIERGASKEQIEEFADRDPIENDIMAPIKETVDVVIINNGDLSDFASNLIGIVRSSFLLDEIASK